MVAMKYTSNACFLLAVASIAMAFMAESPVPLIGFPTFVILGLAFLGGQQLLDVLTQILAELKQAKSDIGIAKSK